MEFSRDDFYRIFDEKQYENIISICKHDYILIDGFHTCQNCGELDINRITFIEKYNWRGYIHIYKRRSYFQERLNLLIGRKQSSSEKYINMLNSLKGRQFKSIQELKRVVKQNKFRGMTKYIYNLYFDLTGKRLIQLSERDMKLLTKEFLVFERNFKKEFPGKKNLLSYDMIIYHLLKKIDSKYYKFIMLPRSNREFIENLLKKY